MHQNLMTETNLSKTMRDRVRLELAADLAELGVYEQAVTRLQEIPERSPLFVAAQERLVELHQRHGRFAAAYESMGKILERRRSWRNRKRAAYFLALQAEQRFREGDSPAAAKMVERALEHDGDCILVIFLQGLLHLEGHRFDQAIDSFTRLIEVNPAFSFLAVPKIEDAFYGKQSFMRLGDCLQTLIQAHPDDAYLLYSLGKFFRKRKLFSESRRFLRTALERHPAFPLAREELLNLEIEEGANEEAARDYRELLEELKAGKQFVCSYCGAAYDELVWNCGSCGRWESVQAELHLNPAATLHEEGPSPQHQTSHP